MYGPIGLTSKKVAIKDMFHVHPYVGYKYLWTLKDYRFIDLKPVLVCSKKNYFPFRKVRLPRRMVNGTSIITLRTMIDTLVIKKPTFRYMPFATA